MKNCILVIDAQNDFVDPKGSLYVPGADKDMKRLSDFILSNGNQIDGIVLVQDTHSKMDIAHPSYWVDTDGNHPNPFTTINAKEAKGRRYEVYMPGAPEKIMLEKQKMVVEYLNNLKSMDMVHTVWPEHCVQGTLGHNIYEPLMSAVDSWTEQTGVNPLHYLKGMFQHTEHFGAFEAVVPDATAPETTIVAAQNILGHMDRFEKVYLCGEAKSHCVAQTLAQIIKIVKDPEFKDLITRYVIVEDVMSDVPGFEDHGKSIFDEARKIGFEFIKLEDIKL